MQPFHFRLEKVLAWRRTELEVEQFKMRRLASEMDAIDRSRAQVALERTTAEREVLRAASVKGNQLGVHAAFLVHLGSRERELARRREEQEQRMAVQHQRLLEARRRLRLLEELKARRRAEWAAELNRELETFAAEAHLARWSAKK